MHGEYVFLHVLRSLTNKIQRVGVGVWLRHVSIFDWFLLFLSFLFWSSLFRLFLLLFIFTWGWRHHFTKLNPHRCLLFWVDLCSNLLYFWLSRYLWACLVNNIKDLVQIDLKLSLSLCPLLQEDLKIFFFFVKTQLIITLSSVIIDIETIFAVILLHFIVLF